MLTPEQIAALRDAAGQIADPVNNYLIEDIARRISEAGQLTGTAQYQIWRAQNLGLSHGEIRKRLQKLLKASEAEIQTLLTQSAEVGYRFDLDRLPTAAAVPFEENPVLQQIVRAAVELAREDFTNITQTLGMVDPYGNALPLQDAYRSACDFAFQQVSTGAADYNTAIRRAVKNLTAKGVRTIDYASGVHTSLEAAVRRSVMGGLGLMQEQIAQYNYDAMGCDGWEISAHAASAPDHEPIQGRQYSDAAYEALNNSLVRRIGTLNCGHTAFPIILGVSTPQYTPEELEKLRADNKKGVTIDGRHYTMYEATQVQRRLETAIRTQKRRILADEATGDKEKLLTDQIKYRRLEQEYKRFSDAAGLRTQQERMELAGFGPKQATAAAKAAEKVVDKPPAEPVRKYVDITGKWYPDAKPNSHTVQDLQSYTVDGITYDVDGHNVVLDYSAHEKEIAELLEKEVGGEIYMVPRVNNPQGVSTPDYLFHGARFDLKSLKSDGKNVFYNTVAKKSAQAENFIFDLTDCPLNDDELNRQTALLFSSTHTKFIDTVVLVKNGKILRVLKRNK